MNPYPDPDPNPYPDPNTYPDSDPDLDIFIIDLQDARKNIIF